MDSRVEPLMSPSNIFLGPLRLLFYGDLLQQLLRDAVVSGDVSMPR